MSECTKSPQWKGVLQSVAVATAALSLCAPAAAQNQDPSPVKLPRPGYEYEGISVGSGLLLAEFDARADYVDNLFLTSQDTAEDLRAIIRASVAYSQQIGTGSIVAEGHGSLIRHKENPRENSNTYGTSLALGLTPSKEQNFDAKVAYDRNIEGRADPETNAGPTDRPRKIDVFLAEGSYRDASGQIRWGLNVGTEKFDLLSPDDADRDQQAYRAAVNMGYRIAASTDIFVEGFANRRDFRLATDQAGIDRDQNTFGAVVGVRRELGDRIQGFFGVGVFRTDPDDPSIEPYTGLRLTGKVAWKPRQRTAVTFTLERGDVATVRSGATTRIDTIARVVVNQEIRHNLLGNLSMSYVERAYRGESRGTLRNAGFGGGLEYLVNRRTSLYTEAGYVERNALAEIDKYNNFVVTLGIRQKL
ncbi:outer membrane beta-barrel protein [Qipengyuania zhejiangensis]|uniref:outer membrane beta-barrel protein n=1 Tax=Qipengyuania zhejiangensis TaxID=3077782 RepID=UPI002D79B2E0|nr:outer membrane beta-barrel protein [Qipengyuania sp. Z2]